MQEPNTLENRLNVLQRTFGFELEMADVDKRNVSLPDGYSWSVDETITNTDGHIVNSRTSVFGGELNTPPLSLCHSDLLTLKGVIDNLYLAGGHGTWSKGFDIHLYVGDLPLDAIKKVFILSYHTSSFIKKHCDMGPWLEFPIQAPAPTIAFVENLKLADDFESMLKVFEMSLRKKYIRHMVNLTSYEKHKTIEFRLFNTTSDFGQVIGSIFFCLRFLEYAITHDEEDFVRIDTYDRFKSELKLHHQLAPKLEPLIFAGDQTNEQDRYVSRAISVSSKMAGVLMNEVGDGNELAICNPRFFELETKVYQKIPLVIYNREEFNHIIYRMAKEGLRVSYTDDLAFINDYNSDDPATQIACLFMFHKLHRLIGDSLYAKKELEAYSSAAEKSLEKLMETSREVVKMFDTCTYVLGTVEDAIAAGHGNVFWQYDNNSKVRSTVFSLKKHSDYVSDFENKPVCYYKLLDKLRDTQRFMMVSKCDVLPLIKLAKNGQEIFYSNKPSKGQCRLNSTIKKYRVLSVDFPPDDLMMDDPSKLMVRQVGNDDFLQLQKVFIRKVHKIKRPTFSFVVFYDGYCVGGFGFEYPKKKEFDMWLISDFCTNNNVWRLSKFILLCVQMRYVKTCLQRIIKRGMLNLYTKVYTTKPVSMKYRSIFKKEHDEEAKSHLLYVSDFGVYSDEKQVIEKYNQWRKNNGK